MVSIDLLGDLGVVVPDARVAPPVPPAAAGVKIVRPVERPPPAGGAPQPRDAATTPQPHGSPQRGRAVHTLQAGGLSPTRIRAPLPRSPGPPRVPSGSHTQLYTEAATNKTIFQVQKGTVVEEYEVYDSEVPCNVVFNAAFSAEKHRADAARQTADARYCAAAIARDQQAKQQEDAAQEAKRAKAVEEIARFKAARAEQEQAKIASEQQAVSRERQRIEDDYARAVEEKVQAAVSDAAAKARMRGDLAAAIVKKREKEQAERAQALAKSSMSGFAIGAPNPDVQAKKAHAQKTLRGAWQSQLETKAQMSAKQHEQTLRVERQALDAEAQALAAAADEQRAAKAAMRQRLQEHKETLRAEGCAKQRARAHELATDATRTEYDSQAAAEARRAAVAEKKSKKDALRAQLVQQVAARAQLETERAQREPKADLAHNGLTSTHQRQVLLRCPVTNQMLPPSAFNAQQTSKRTRVIVA